MSSHGTATERRSLGRTATTASPPTSPPAGGDLPPDPDWPAPSAAPCSTCPAART